ncbi:hypothetical protein S40288_03703 [Stachybotrys chartarum IBT 40288]|nr:hypothetical protein S40288_03703 [Stachybotrys chartarum IBT 40288]
MAPRGVARQRNATQNSRSSGSMASTEILAIKQEPSPVAPIADRSVSLLSDTDNASSHLAADYSSRAPFGRSDAPTPSERLGEPGPMMREVRPKRNLPAYSPVTLDESFFDNNSYQDIGKKLKACNDTLGELQQLGVSHHIQLPELVLVGDQSAGKSSLMSGLANLELPRSEGACTRCPLHIRVSRSSDWSCRVSLRKDYAYQPPAGDVIDETDVTQQNPFFPWVKVSNNRALEFKTMNDRSEIEDVLRWAQIAILNDDKNHELFIPGSGAIATSTPIAEAAQSTRAKFSPNIVSLEIKGPELPDLSFYDMPGIFQNTADSRDNYLVNVVRNLSTEYIQHPSAIIMCLIPMNNDAENSSTFSLTRRLGASDRTIGVLTKADKLPENSNNEPWVKIMQGLTHQTGLGYFITSRPKDRDLEDLKEWEDKMFHKHLVDAWPAEFRGFEKRCGVENLKGFLSERLGKEFVKNLPKIKQKVITSLNHIKRELASLPELPENVESEVRSAMMKFAESARAGVDGFLESFNNPPASFRDCLLDMKPKFVLKDRTDSPVVEISDDESEAGSVAGNKRRAAVNRTPSKRPRNDMNGAATPSASFNGYIKPEEDRGSVTPQASASPAARRVTFPEPYAAFSNVGKSFRTLRAVREEIQAKTISGMPNRTPDKIFQDLVKEAVKPWNGPMEVFLKQTMSSLQTVLEQALGKALENLKKRSIYKESKKHIRQWLNEHHQQTRESLAQLYHNESSQLLTFNNGAFTLYQKEALDELQRFRYHMRMVAAGSAPSSRTLVPWESLSQDMRDKEFKKREADSANLGPDPFKREVEVIGYVRAYYRLAALRFADSVAQCLMCRMIPQIRMELSYHLEEKLGVRNAGPDIQAVYERLLEEDPAIAMKRANLKNQRETFTKALMSIQELETGGAEDTPELSQVTQAVTEGGYGDAMHVDEDEA